jgi:hypothetical protein
MVPSTCREESSTTGEREAFIRVITWIARNWPDVDPVDLIMLSPLAAPDRTAS